MENLLYNSWKETCKGLFILNALPWLAVADQLKIENNKIVTLLAGPSTIVSIILFSIPITIFRLVTE